MAERDFKGYNKLIRVDNFSKLPRTSLSGGFEFDKEYYMELVEGFKRLISVIRLGTNMDFTC